MELPLLLEPMRFLFFWGAVLLARLIGGTGAGLLAVVLSVVAAAYLEFPWTDIATGRDRLDVARLAIYAAWASAISIAVGLRDAANRRVDLLREWLATTLHSIGDGVIVTDEKGKIVFLDPVAASITGWPLEEALGKPVTDVFVVRNEKTLAPVENPVTQVLRTQAKVSLEEDAVLLDRAGAAIPIDDSAAPIRSHDESIRGVVLVFRDVTRRRAAEKALIQADNAKDQFLATLSHDLRTRRSCSRMRRGCGRSSGNLISNAIKFSPDGGTIELEMKDGAGIVELNVTDHGIGIDSAALPRVFERFQQAHGEHSVKLGGLGLGLAIVKDLAELHGGTVTASSAGRGTGATFTVRLPLAA